MSNEIISDISSQPLINNNTENINIDVDLDIENKNEQLQTQTHSLEQEKSQKTKEQEVNQTQSQPPQQQVINQPNIHDLYIPPSLSYSQSAINIYSLENYTFGIKEPQFNKDKTINDYYLRMEYNYNKEGLKYTSEGILLVHNYNHIHILLLQSAIDNTFKLPGGKIKVGEDNLLGLKRKLIKKLAPVQRDLIPDFEIGELVATWWRPNFDQYLYPYIPSHITKIKECKKMYMISLPQACMFAIPRNYKLLAVPLHELHENPQKYGNTLAALTYQLSRFHFNFMK